MSSVNIETRRVQRFGKSTLMVSLPAEWVRTVNLKPGDTVTIIIDDDNTLRIFPTFVKPEKRERRLIIRASKVVNAEVVYKIVTSAYTLGYDKIYIEVVDGFLEEDHLKTIRKLSKELIGTEIIEHMPSRIVIQVFIDPAKYSIHGIITRMGSIIRSMVNYLYIILSEDKLHYISEIQELGSELERLSKLATRQTFVAQIDRIYASTLNIRSYMLPRYRTITRSLDIIGESIINATEILSKLSPNDRRLLRSLADEIKEILDLYITSIDKAIGVILEPNIARAFNTELLARELRLHISRFIEKHQDTLKAGENYVALSEFFEYFRRSATDIEVMTDVSFDLTVEKHEGVIDLSIGEALKIV